MEFITNKENLLKEIMENIIPSSENLYFLVGYFYFSGFELLKKSLSDKNVKILIGMDIDKDLNNKIYEYYYIDSKKIDESLIKVRENYCEKIKYLFETDIFDNSESFDRYRLFKEKLNKGTLEIRKTKEPNHSKLYIFEKKRELNEGGTYPGAIITGSSNLSYSGIKSQAEINILSRERKDFEECKKIFDELWEEAYPIFDKNNFEYFYNNIDKYVPVDKLPKPYLLYIKVLDEYFNREKARNIKLPALITNNKYFNFQYQIDAIGDAIQKIKTHNGVIISDVVGLGKSIIAATVAHNLGLFTIIISPPHLKEQWEDYIVKFDIDGKIYTSGSIDKANNDLKNDFKEKLIIVDECHKYRNELTKSYGELWKLCAGNKVILLSATPFNNTPEDIFSMVKLFQIPSKSTIQTVDNLSNQFFSIIEEYKNLKKDQKNNKSEGNDLKKSINEISKKIRDLISPVVIRRTRVDLNEIESYKKDLEMQGISFPIVKEPILLEYNLGDKSSLYLETLENIYSKNENKGFIGARYKPITYLKSNKEYIEKISKEFGNFNLFIESQTNLAKFMKKLLVRRFESSIYAFKRTLDNIIRSNEIIVNWHEKLKLVPIYKRGDLPDVEEIAEIDDPDSNEISYNLNKDDIEYYKKNGMEFIKAEDLKEDFINDVKKDINLLNMIKKEWFPEDKISNDPKLLHFKNIIKDMLENEPDRKIVVFSEFKDTVTYIYESIKNDFKIFKYSSEDARLETNKIIIKENFDASIDIDKQKNDYNILVATDVISEGYNLNRAGAIFNYDIPYNPTRVIQRVGRINRINKKVFNELYIYNFFPTDIGEKETRTKEISTLKISVIQAVLGEDTKVLTKDEELKSYFNEKYKIYENNEEPSWDNKYKNIMNVLKQNFPELIEEAKNLPKRVRIRRNINQSQGIIIFAKKGNEFVFKFSDHNNNIKTLSPEDAIKIFETNESEAAFQVSDNFEEIYQKMKKELFIRKTETRLDQGINSARSKIEYLKSKLPEKKEYFNNLLKVLKEYNALPEVYAKFIRSISEQNLNEDVQNLEIELQNDYLLKIIKKANSIDDEEEILILSEEIKKI